jgi:hypothetical protein
MDGFDVNRMDRQIAVGAANRIRSTPRTRREPY